MLTSIDGRWRRWTMPLLVSSHRLLGLGCGGAPTISEAGDNRVHVLSIPIVYFFQNGRSAAALKNQNHVDVHFSLVRFAREKGWTATSETSGTTAFGLHGG
eukprot:scaffold168625_cov46-Attheya_sp.AAC.2